LAESGVYHVMMRGVNKDAIFLEDEDRVRFLHALTLTKQASGCIVLAYCLMTNHVHLVLQTPDEPISLVMKRLGVRYVGWFNRKYSRVGHLFQDRFASIRVEDCSGMSGTTRWRLASPSARRITDGAAGARSRSPGWWTRLCCAVLSLPMSWTAPLSTLAASRASTRRKPGVPRRTRTTRPPQCCSCAAGLPALATSSSSIGARSAEPCASCGRGRSRIYRSPR
jgi:REP element-mobilizing transposase RayT